MPNLFASNHMNRDRKRAGGTPAPQRCGSPLRQVIALGNLLPQQGEADDLDSYMFQTVGHQVLDAYAACAGLPLFRRRILGESKHRVKSRSPMQVLLFQLFTVYVSRLA